MAIPTSCTPCSSLNAVRSLSSPSQFLPSSPFYKPWKSFMAGTRNSHLGIVVQCASSDMDSSDFLSLRQVHMQSMPSFGLSSKEDMSKPAYKWRRVLLKVSGEALAGDNVQNIDPKVTTAIAREVASVTRLGIEVAIVVGGGNIFRGSSWAGSSGLDRSSADYIGMLATVMNAIFLQATMESVGIPTRVQTAFRMSEVAEPYIRRRAVRHLEKGRVVIFAAGTGNPFFTTDTAAALRCAETSFGSFLFAKIYLWLVFLFLWLKANHNPYPDSDLGTVGYLMEGEADSVLQFNAEVVLKATNVDGVYDDDPRQNPNARLLDTLSYQDVISKELSVMDLTAITLCQENNIPVVVFNLNQEGNISRAIKGERVGTIIGGQWNSAAAEIQ
ncbi:hypothetical protein Cgig2_028443 [Carnegiea gigantea]|uniref:UMP kinase n=1 Tax=Carnegiea gigantea TaxID=171969 RepID=A0A9Q1QM03_9CARY|nr:hypothetical protein Cgig2_028443 [Carnegiea gigantea]